MMKVMMDQAAALAAGTCRGCTLETIQFVLPLPPLSNQFGVLRHHYSILWFPAREVLL